MEAVQQNCHLGTAQESFDVCSSNPRSSRPYSSQARRRWQRDTPLLRLPNLWPTPTHTPPQREKGRTDQRRKDFFNLLHKSLLIKKPSVKQARKLTASHSLLIDN